MDLNKGNPFDDEYAEYLKSQFLNADSDPEFGEWLGYLRRDGEPTLPPCKGHTYKGPFHVMRMLAKCVKMLEDNGIV